MEESSETTVTTIDDLKKEIRILKEDNTKNKRNLMWKVRKLEKDKVLIENDKIRLEREVKNLRAEVERFRAPPLIIATVLEVLDSNKVAVKSTTGPHFVINYSKYINQESLINKIEFSKRKGDRK